MIAHNGTLEGMAVADNLVVPVWEPLIKVGAFLGDSTIVNAELTALEQALVFVQQIVRREPIQFNHGIVMPT